MSLAHKDRPVVSPEIKAAIERLNDPHRQRHGSPTYVDDCMTVAEWARKLYQPDAPPPVFTGYAHLASGRTFEAMVFCIQEING